MNKQKFVEYLRTPSNLDTESLGQLEALVNDYPYFQGARTLLAKGSKILKSKNAGANISSAAVYATDRALLKRYINDELIFLSPLTVHESHEADRERDLTDTIKTNRITTAQSKQIAKEEPPKPKPQPKPIIQDEAPAPEPSVPETSKSSDLDHIIDELYRDLEELKINRARFNKIENELTEEEAVDNAVKKATQKTTAAPEPEETKEVTPEPAPSSKEESLEADTPEEPKAEAEAEVAEAEVSQQKEEPIAEKADEPQPDTDPEEEKPRDIVRKPSESRSARVSRITEENEPLEPKKTKAESKKVAKKPAKTAKAAGKTKPTTTKQKPESKKKSADTPKKKAQKKDKKKSEEGNKKDDKGEPKRVNQDDIITNFIKSNPSISPASKSAANAQVDLSGASTELHPEIASEYLAEIYLQQGKKDRAVQIYEALIVRFPEKTTYFADIIKKINQ